MPDYRSYDRDPRRYAGERPVRSSSGPQPGISRSGAPRRPASQTSAPRTGAPRTGAPRSSGARPASRPQNPNYRASSGGRPPQGGRRPAPRRRKRGVQPRFFVILGVLVVLVIVLIAIFGGGGKKDAGPMATPTVAPDTGLSNATVSSSTPDPNAPETAAPENMEQAMAAPVADDEEEKDNAPKISAAEQVQVSPEQLQVNTSLPSEWLNVLLLGTDERWLNEPARTDTMIIASINTGTGEVKLTSLMRDTAVKFEDLGKNNGTYRINAANYFGGPLYAIKTVNECLDMNIQYYVSVNFYGFTRIAQALGGIDVDISEAEMNEINKKQVEQAVVAATVGVDESDQINELLETYGPNTHLNGRQTLAYARVRKIDSDFARTERQRTVIMKLTEKLRGKSAAEIIALLASLSGNVTTNMDLETVSKIAITVLSSGLSNIETLHLPKNGTYQLDRRNDQEMFYDTDWQQNSLLLYNFIYE